MSDWEKLNAKMPSKVEHKMVELKARVDDLDDVRRKLTSLGAKHIGTVRQVDVYFDVPKGRLKLREVVDDKKAELIYYERSNVAGPKRSNDFILKIQEPAFFKTLLERLLKTSSIVKKVREIYRYRRTPLCSKYRCIQVHLDEVEKLGSYVEFEMESSARTEERDKQIFEGLMKDLAIKRFQLEKLSYSDLLRSA